MTSAYPGALDALTNPVAGDFQNSPSHSGQHTDANDAIEAIQATLGIDPHGSAADVAERLATLTPTIDSTAPSSPVLGQVWYDDTTTPYIGSVWNGTAWESFSGAGDGGAALVWATVAGGTVTTVTNPDGSTDEVHTFTAGGTLVCTASGYAEVLLVSGGSSLITGIAQGGGGSTEQGLRTLAAGSLAVVVGAGGTTSGAIGTTLGTPSSIAGVARTGYGQTDRFADAATDATTAARSTPITSLISGTSRTYAAGSDATSSTGYGDGKAGGTAGNAGVVIVRVKVTPAPALPASTGWAQVTGGTVSEYTKPDGSVMEVHRYTADSTLVVVQAGYAEVLLVGAGGPDNAPHVVTGLHPLAAGTLPVQVGTVGNADTGGGAPQKPSFIGAYPTLLWAASSVTALAANYGLGAGADYGGAVNTATRIRGIKSAITGTEIEYGQMAPSTTFPGGGGNKAGVVIVAVQKTPPTASGVVASGGTETTFTGDGVNGVLGQGYKVHKFTASGTLVVSAAGECDILIASGGSGAAAGGQGGLSCVVLHTDAPVSVGSVAVTVGAAGSSGAVGPTAVIGKPSAFGSRVTYASGFTWDGAFIPAALSSGIDGTVRDYGRPNTATPRTNSGDGASGSSGGAGAAGVVIVRYRV